MVSQSTLLPPQLAVRDGRPDDPLECSVHTLPKPLLREFQHVFGQEYLEEMAKNVNSTSLDILAIPTNQQARKDLVAVGDDIELEKDRLLNVVRCSSMAIVEDASAQCSAKQSLSCLQFMEFGEELCKRIRSCGFWADYIDPCSGLPMITPNCNKVYSEGMLENYPLQ